MLKRLAFFAYGGFAYLVFLGTFLYAIAFVGGFGVPTRLDGEPTAPLPVSLAIDLGLLTLFAVQHSVMARRWFKERWTTIVSPAIERSTYVLCASLALILLFWQWRPLGGVVWTVENPAVAFALWAVFASGWGLVLLVTFLINHFDLFGLRQVWLALVGVPYSTISFRTPAPYRVVRHPLYFGFLLAFWMTPTMTLAHLVFAIVTTGVHRARDSIRGAGPRGGARRRLPHVQTARADACSGRAHAHHDGIHGIPRRRGRARARRHDDRAACRHGRGSHRATTRAFRPGGVGRLPAVSRRTCHRYAELHLRAGRDGDRCGHWGVGL